ncbi:hypothetical protein K505DRAFT_308235 [Melanomma pulvis-pyrius CBS 109.77]|uniref:C2H2-type domain-containing protein n=1 Tax=Melanomma pulvis-pyrius CBS 109.77 TaxID=1314802 RepID=A0A6A6X6Z8_9PLEO|nr:hypothetical protein K505DRAFT_308235 [Melanomma pulvis-pyrius CBS 109.77]
MGHYSRAYNLRNGIAITGQSRYHLNSQGVIFPGTEVYEVRERLEGLWELVRVFNLHLKHSRDRIGNQVLKNTPDFELLDHFSPEGEIENRLRTIYAYHADRQARSDSVICDISFIHTVKLNSFMDMLDEQYEKVELEFELLRIFEEDNDAEQEEKRQQDWNHIEWILRQSAMLLERLLDAVLSFWNFSEFPNRCRPPCRTMPWDIRPALLVLWGVCWMFYPPSSTPQQDEYDTVQGVGLLNTYSDFSNEAHGPTQSQPFSDCFDQLSNPPQGNFEIPWAWDSAYGVNLYGFSFEEMQSDHAAAYQASQSPERNPMQPLALASDTIPNDSNGREMAISVGTIPTYTIEPSNLNHLLQSSTAANDQYLIQPNLPTTLPMIQDAGSQIMPTMALSPASASNDQPTQPPRDFEGRMICDHDGCDTLTFQRRSAWETHMNKHNRPFNCDATDCTHLNGFSTKGLLERHKRAKHIQILPHGAVTKPNSKFYCRVPSCDRSSSSPSNKPFTRKDNRDDHIKRKHPDLPLPPRADVLSGSLLAENSQYPLTSDRSGRDNPAEQEHAAMSSTGKRRRLEERISFPESTGFANEDCCGHREETEQLRKKVKDLEHELASSKKREDTLFDIIREYKK